MSEQNLIGSIIHDRRIELGLTLEQVGNSVGVSKSTVKKWESGFISNMGRDKIAALAKCLDLNPIVLVTGSSTEEQKQPPEGGKSELIELIIRELAALPTDKQQDVLRYIRFLRNG